LVGIGHCGKGIRRIVVPGSGEPNLDTSDYFVDIRIRKGRRRNYERHKSDCSWTKAITKVYKKRKRATIIMTIRSSKKQKPSKQLRGNIKSFASTGTNVVDDPRDTAVVSSLQNPSSDNASIDRRVTFSPSLPY